MLIPPRRIVLSGGGIRAVAHVGALRGLAERGYLSRVREWVGVSAGALICFLFSIGYTIQQIETLSIALDFGLIRSVEPEGVFHFLDSFGFDTGENVEKLIKSLLKGRSLPPDLTFEQAEKLGCSRLRVFSTNLRTCQLVEFSLQKTPKVQVVTALRATMSLPLYFVPVTDTKRQYILTDGGVLGNYPIHHLTPSEQRETLGFTFDHDTSVVKDVSSLAVFLSQLAASYYVPRNREQVLIHAHRTVIIPCGAYPSWNFEASQEDRKKLMDIGHKATLQFLDCGLRSTLPRGIRRYSVS